MAASDPTGGVGYAFGAKLPHDDVNTVFTQQVRLWDIVQGGSYTVTGNTTVTRSASQTWTFSVPTTWNNSFVLLTSSGLLLDSSSYVAYSPAVTYNGYCNTPSSVVCFASTVVSGGSALDWTLGASIGSGVAATSCAVVQQQVDAANSNFAIVDFDLRSLLRRGTVEAVQLFIDPAGAGSNPQSMPQLSLWKRSDSGVETQIGSTTTDASGSYRTGHYLSLDVSAAVAGDAYQYNPNASGETLFARFRGENGTNAAAGLAIQSIAVQQEITYLL